jgi:hypothetical protein
MRVALQYFAGQDLKEKNKVQAMGDRPLTLLFPTHIRTKCQSPRVYVLRVRWKVTNELCHRTSCLPIA